MYFYKHKGRQCLDLQGDLVLTHNDALVKARVKSAAPAGVHNARYVPDIARLGFVKKLRASWSALRFIWSRKSQALDVKRDEL
ncbi:hypothetical protein K0U83_23470 [bacterium]|nr:hypothetical protein [bacterium]